MPNDDAKLIGRVLAAYQEIADRFATLLGLHQQQTAALALSDLDEFNRLGPAKNCLFDSIIHLRGDALPDLERWWTRDIPPEAQARLRELLLAIDCLLDRISLEQQKHQRRFDELAALRHTNNPNTKGGGRVA